MSAEEAQTAVGAPRSREEATVLVTGATSQLGRLVVGHLLARGYLVRALVRQPRESKTAEVLREEHDAAVIEGALQLVPGDILEPDLGLGRPGLTRLRDVTEIIHLARPRASEAAPRGALVPALDGVVGLARRLGRAQLRRVVVLSSTEMAGTYGGRFYEDWLEVGQSFEGDAGRAYLELEIRARDSAERVPMVVARHALLVGHSRTGAFECDAAGLSRLFALGPTLRKLPSWTPLPGAAAGERYITVSPLDYVAEGLVVLACSEAIEPSAVGATFCLADPTPPTLGGSTDMLLDRVGGPAPSIRLPVDGRGPVGATVLAAARAAAALSKAAGKGQGALSLLLQRGEHDVGNALTALEPFGVSCPRLATYLDALYTDYQARRGRSS